MYLSYVLLIMRGYISAVPNAFSLGQRRPGAPGSGTAGTGARGACMHSTTGRGRDCQSLDSDVLPTRKPVCIEEICD